LINVILQVLFFAYGAIPLILKDTRSLYGINSITFASTGIIGFIFIFFWGISGAVATLIFNNVLTLYLYKRNFDLELVRFDYKIVALTIVIFLIVGLYFEYLYYG